VSASGVFQLEVGPWQNALSVTAAGRCCSDVTTSFDPAASDCRLPCRTFVSVCLTHYQAVVPNQPQCTYGSFVSSADQFSHRLQRCHVDIPFEFAWPVIITFYTFLMLKCLLSDTFSLTQRGSYTVFMCDSYASRVLAMVWASVCLSVTSLSPIKTAQATITKSSLWPATRTLV